MPLPADHVTILLCTRNGARYLPDQLDSIAGQTFRRWSLWISDDGSTDDTWAMLKRFRADHPDHDIRLLHGAGQGAAANYLSLLCHPELAPGTVALCDQDDQWLTDKLARAVAALGVEEDAPAAYAATSIVTDEDLRETGRIPPAPRGPSFANALVQNILHGSTLVLTPGALSLIRQAGPVPVRYHDWWIYLVLTGCGARLVQDPEPALKYRQHGQNEIGYNRAAGAARSRAGLILNGTYRRWMAANARALLAANLPLLPECRTMAEEFLALQARSGPARVAGYRRMGIHRQSPAATAFLQTCAMLGYA